MNDSPSRLSSPPRRVAPAIPILIIAVIVCVVAAIVYPDFMSVLPATLAFIATVCIVAKRLSPLALAPSLYFAGYLAIVAILGVFLSNALVGAGGTGGVDVKISVDLATSTANTMLGAGIIVLLAASVVRGKNRGGVTAESILNLGAVARFSTWFLIFGTLELAALVAFQGQDLLQRSFRLVGRGSTLETVISMAAVAAVVVVGIAFFSMKGVARLYALLLILGFTGYFVGMGTRRLALVPILLMLAYAIARGGRLPIFGLIATGAAGLLALALPLHFRGQATHGLIPYLSSLSTFQLSPEVIATSFNNFLAGFKITALTSVQAPIPRDVLWISLNPISGDDAGWYTVAATLRLNRFTPYSALGELMNYGTIVFILVMIGIGIALGLIQRLNDQLLVNGIGRFIAIISLGLVFIFVIQSAQYNLRSDVRYLYLALGAQLIGLALLRTHGALARRHSPGGNHRLRHVSQT